MSNRTTTIPIVIILVVAFGFRVRYLMAGVPLAVEIDEPAIVDRALAIMNSGNWNPRGFDYPSLVVYLQAAVNIAQFLRGAVEGLWPSLDQYAIGSAYEGGRFVSAVIGTATVWLTYRLGRAVMSPALGALAAAQLAVYPMHVRESHFVLTDSPATALVTLTLLLTVRAARVQTVAGYSFAAAAAGLSAAAKYNAGIVLCVLPVAWLLFERHSRDRGPKALAMLLMCPLAFLCAVPYAVIRIPEFLTGLGSQVGRFSAHSLASGDEPPWRVYLAHLSLASSVWLPLAAAGAAITLWHREALARWAIPCAFLVAYFYVLSTHPIVFGRYALPLLPALCLLTSVPLLELGRVVDRRWHDVRLGRLAVGVAALIVIAPLISGSVDWLRELHRLDTRDIAGQWMTAAIPKGTRLVVENSGPTNLDHLGYELVDRPNRLDPSADIYTARGAQYIVIATFSESELSAYDPILSAGPVLLRVDPGGNRWGPFIRAVKLEPGH